MTIRMMFLDNSVVNLEYSDFDVYFTGEKKEDIQWSHVKR